MHQIFQILDLVEQDLQHTVTLPQNINLHSGHTLMANLKDNDF